MNEPFDNDTKDTFFSRAQADDRSRGARTFQKGGADPRH